MNSDEHCETCGGPCVYRHQEKPVKCATCQMNYGGPECASCQELRAQTGGTITAHVCREK